MLNELPQGVLCFIDANIFYYHFVEVPLLSDECSGFLERVERGEVTGATSANAVADAIHKVMLKEVAFLYNEERAGLLAKLKKHPEWLNSVSSHKAIIPLINSIQLHIEPITLELLESATELSVQYRLLTNDALILATMKKFGIEHLATNDDDFDNISDIQVWKPR